MATQPCPQRLPLLPHPKPPKQAIYTPSRTPTSAGSSNAHRQTSKTLLATKSPNALAASPPSLPLPPSHPPVRSTVPRLVPSPPHPPLQLPPPRPPRQLASSSHTTRMRTKGCTCTSTGRTMAVTRATRLITAGAPSRLRLSISPRMAVIPACCRRMSWARSRRTGSKDVVIRVRVARRRGR